MHLHLHLPAPAPYMPAGEAQGLVYHRLASSLDKINNLSLGQGSSAIECMYQAVVVSGRPATTSGSTSSPRSS